MVYPVSSHLPWSSPCAPRLDFPNLLFSEQFIYDTAEFTLCYGLYDCSPSFEDFIHPLSTLHYCNAPDLATRLTGDYRDRTYTDRHGPALLDTRAPTKKSWYAIEYPTLRHTMIHFHSNHVQIIKLQYFFCRSYDIMLIHIKCHSIRHGGLCTRP